MTVSEIVFLGVGLVLGAALGAAIAQVLRGRPPGRRAVKLTITPNAIPASRTRTLAVPHATPHPGRIPGSPESRPDGEDQPPAPGPAAGIPAPQPGIRTRVPSPQVTLPSSAVAVPVARPVGSPPAPPPAPAERATGAPAGGLPAGPGSAALTFVDPAAGRAVRPSAPGPAPAGPAGPPLPAIDSGNVPRALDAPARPGGLPAQGEGRIDSPSGIAGSITAPATGVAVVEWPARVIAPDPAATPGPVPDREEGFVTLVRPWPPTDEGRPMPSARAAPVTGPAPGGTTSRPTLPPTRLAAPSQPTLTRPPASTADLRPHAPDLRPHAPDLRPHAARGGDLPAGQAARGTGTPGSPEAASGPCAGLRRVVDERCALAAVARDQARSAADALHGAQRAYDTLRERVDLATATADPRRVAAEKDRLHAAFRASTDQATGSAETEAAARAWLDEINALNAAVREASRLADTGGAELRAAHPALERLSADADAARIAAENAEQGCGEARQALAECEEAEVRAALAEEPHPFAGVWPEEPPAIHDPSAAPAPAAGRLPAIARVLRGDRGTRDRLAATLASGDEAGEREWQLRISRLVDAIVGRAIEDGYLNLPVDDPFWRLFGHREARDIVGALSALGFRYDGLGGFADGRVPAARDLSLAVGYAGLDRMRIRTWPREADLVALYSRAEVSADEWLADQAGDLTLGRMVDALGGRAAELADVWNAWGRVRNALLAE